VGWDVRRPARTATERGWPSQSKRDAIDLPGAASFLKSTVAMIRWTLYYGDDRVTCGLHRDTVTSTYVVSVVPNGNAKSAMTETCASGVAALERHAAIVTALRARGWKVLAYSDAPAAADRHHRTAA
jgi:hypothetical protein